MRSPINADWTDFRINVRIYFYNIIWLYNLAKKFNENDLRPENSFGGQTINKNQLRSTEVIE